MKPVLRFDRYENFFRVYIENFNLLSVEQIQAFEDFVKQRRGVFSFDGYFDIQRKLSFESFVKLMTSLGFDAVYEEIIHEKNRPRIGFGQYKGLYYDELPDSYLLWLKNNLIGKDKTYINDEISRRGL